MNSSDQQYKNSGVSHHYIQLPSVAATLYVTLLFIVAVAALVVKMYKRRNSAAINDSYIERSNGDSTGYMAIPTTYRRVVQVSPENP